MRTFTKLLLLGLTVFFAQIAVHAQTTGSLSGTITDQANAVVAGATVTLQSNIASGDRSAVSDSKGNFDFQALLPGTYSITVEASGFKKSIAREIVVSLALNTQVNLQLEIGLANESVTVTATQEVLNTSSPSLTNVINTRQVVDLPIGDRNPLQLAGLQAGIAVTGDNVRGSSIAGLRQTATNVTQDGINAMDNFVKTSSLFAISTPSLNSTAEFSITTGTVGSDQGRGVGQVTLVTRSGTNEYHGSAFYMNRNDALQANTFFNNALGTPRGRQNQHFFGFDIGGPIYAPRFGEGGPALWSGKDKATFFFAYEGFRDNFSVTRNRTVLTPEARQGIFRYTRICPTNPPNPACTPGVQTVNLLAIGTQNTLNPITMGILNQIPTPNNSDVGDGFNTGGFRYNVNGVSNNDKYVGRYDHQLVSDTRLGSHKLEFVLNYFKNILSPDTFNGLEAPFPGLVNSTQGGPRWLVTGALVSNFGSSMTNVFRVGKQWAPVGFLLEQEPTEDFIDFQGITDPYAGGNFQSQGRDTQVWQISDNFSWSKGNHLIRFGGDYQQIFADTFNDVGTNPTIVLGTPSHNTGGIQDSSFPFSNASITTSARNTFANLVGNLSSASAVLNVTSPTSGFVPGATRARLFQQRDLALYVQDQWRVRNSLTINGGIRWDYMGVPTIPNGLAIQLTDHRHIFGVSGFGNLFNPTAAAGAAPAIGTLDFVSGDTGKGLYNNDWNNFAPFFGFAWSPQFESGIGKLLFGGSGKSSIRGGYSISYIRDGFTVISNAMGVGTTNPGLIATAAQTTPTGVLTGAGVPLPAQNFAIPITDRANNLLNSNNSLWAIDPELRTPYVQQWSFGIEREIARDTAIEIRYSANHAVKLYRAVDFNEINIFENGFLNEFLLAQRNLTARGGTSFAPNGTAGLPACATCVPLPIMSRFFTGLTLGNGFSNAAFITNLNNNNVGSIASTLAFSNTYRANRENVALGIPSNFFVANPNANAARFLTNDSMSNYHSLQVEVRKRLSDGLMFQADYTFSKALTDAPDAQGNNQSTLENFRTFRDKRLDYRRSNDDQAHRFVGNVLYDLPFGRGRRYLSGTNSFVNHAVGGWTVGTIAVWSTRPPFFITSGRTTVNAWPAGTEANNLPAQLVGMTFEEFSKNVGVFRTPGGIFWFNPELLNITFDARGRVLTSTLKPGLLGQPAPGTFGNFPMNSIDSGRYFTTDVSVIKRVPITERVSFELKTTFINILNNANFSYGNTQFDSTSFGRITATSGSQRVIHFMGSVRF
ncbi:MAG TPA: TonB-dependent receptor [Pyrinomonadaceae bacterium]|nr:TonB-dependent receptor [Pyrinomonadaceae bacterium]